MSLFSLIFSNIEEPRTDINIKHDLLDILFITLAGVLSGAEGWSEIYEFAQTKFEWFKKYRSFDTGLPSEDTIARVIKLIDPVALNQSFMA